MIPERPWYVSLGWAPFLPLGGYLFPDFTGVHPIGAQIRGSYQPVALPWGMLGFEITPAFAVLGASTPGLADASMFHLGLGVTTEITLRPRVLFAQVRASLNLDTMDGFAYPIPDSTGPLKRSTPESLWTTGFSAGTSVVIVMTNHLFAEVGIDFGLLFSIDPLPTYIRPSLALGYRYSTIRAEVPPE
jgi:hypothetical protein